MLVEGDLAGASILSAIFLTLLVVAELWRRFGQPDPEWTRKLVHLGGGVTCLLLPFLVRSIWVVLGLALALTATFALGGRLGLLQSLHAVDRKSRGAEYYPLAVFMTFVLARDRPWLFLASVLVLAVADAFAALIGSRYGKLRYGIENQKKSVEGSLVFLILAFLAIHLPTLLLTDLPRPVTVLAALLVAILVTGFEAISLRGTDNLFVPLAVVFILGKITTKPLSEVIFQNASLLGICLLVAVLVWRFPLFNVGAAVTLVLYAYGTWSLGSWQWGTPVLLGLVCYLLTSLFSMRPGAARPLFRVRAVAYALLPPFVMLILANTTRDYQFWFGPYLAASGTVLALSLIELLAWSNRRGRGETEGETASADGWRRERPGWQVAAISAVVGWGAVVALPWLANPEVPGSAVAALLAAVALAALTARPLLQPADGPPLRGWPAAYFLLSLAAAAALALAQRAAGLPSWSPG